MKCEVCGATSSRRCRLHMRFISQCTCIRCTVTCQTRHRKRGQHSCFARVGFATNTASSVSIRARDSYCTAALLLRFLYVTRRDLEKCLRFFFLFFFFFFKEINLFWILQSWGVSTPFPAWWVSSARFLRSSVEHPWRCRATELGRGRYELWPIIGRATSVTGAANQRSNLKWLLMYCVYELRRA